MRVVCLDLEGVLVPEIWIAFSKATGIEELKITTRDEPDYSKLMKYRIDILEKKGLRLSDIQKVIAGMAPLPGAAEFLSALRAKTQVVILSDTFEQFAQPLMAQLGYPSIFCNTLLVDGRGMISGFRLRQEDGKRKAVEALKSINFRVFAAGDSYNDLSMIAVADAGALFNPPESIRAKCPDRDVAMDYRQFMGYIDAFLEKPL
jgi:phosphoserine / homoserine phosphotransferase